VDQNRKPGVPPSKDISDLKARLGLKRPDGAAPGGPAGPGGPAAAARPAPAGFPQPGRAPMPGQGSGPVAAPRPAAPAAAPQPAGMNPYSGMKAPQGGFDLRTIDDGVPAANVRSGRGKATLFASALVGAAAFVLGGWAGIVGVARSNQNTANHAAVAVKKEVEGMQKTLTQIAAIMQESRSRLAKDKKDPGTYDEQLIANLSKVKLDPRPNTATIFRVDFYRLPDADVDHLFTYYYNSIALYGEVESHVKKSKADAESLKAYAEKSASQTAKNYGVVFDNSGGKFVVANLVEIGDQVCKNGGKECGANDLTGFKVRSNTGAPWVDRKSGGKLDSGNVIPMKPTPFMDAVMTGSPDQVRQESYKLRVANMVARLSTIMGAHKELAAGVEKAAARPDIWTVF